MLRINCPFCGLRNHDEFTYLEDGATKPDIENVNEKDWHEAIFLRKNPRGQHIELWHHSYGCRLILRLQRDTLTHEITSIIPANPHLASFFKQIATKKTKRKNQKKMGKS